MALFDLIAEKHRWILPNIGRWLLAFTGSVLGASFLASAIFAASGSDSDLLPFDQVLLVAWIFTSYYAAIYGFIPAVLLTYLCEHYSLHDKSLLIFMAAGVLTGLGLTMLEVLREQPNIDLPFALHAPLTGAIGGLAFGLLRRKLSPADPERRRSSNIA